MHKAEVIFRMKVKEGSHSTEVLRPSKESLNLPAPLVAAQRPSILYFVLRLGLSVYETACITKTIVWRMLVFYSGSTRTPST